MQAKEAEGKKKKGELAQRRAGGQRRGSWTGQTPRLLLIHY